MAKRCGVGCELVRCRCVACPDTSIERFLENGFDLRRQLATYLAISDGELEERLRVSTETLAALHPGAFDTACAESFYEETVGNSHLLELGSWHLSSAAYIADTLRLQERFAHGQVLDFGGGIGSHAMAAAGLPRVEKVWYVDLNPENRAFVSWRAERLGLDHRLNCCRDLESSELPLRFDTIVCLDVLEHLSNPSAQLETFADRLALDGISLLNWYFFKGFGGEYPFHIDDPEIVERFFLTLQRRFLEVFHPFLITTRAYRLMSGGKAGLDDEKLLRAKTELAGQQIAMQACTTE
jgi:hypothetical protein